MGDNWLQDATSNEPRFESHRAYCIWDMLGRRIQAREPPVQNIRQLEAALHREWQQLSQQDIQRLTGGMRRRVEAVIQDKEQKSRLRFGGRRLLLLNDEAWHCHSYTQAL
jgi:hypothetical protein